MQCNDPLASTLENNQAQTGLEPKIIV